MLGDTAVDNSRPPYVAFERRAIEDRDASIKAGHYVAKDVDFVTITRPGSKDSVEKEANTWLKELAEKARSGYIPHSWPELFEKAYDYWKKGEAAPEAGTPIKGWAVIGPAMQATLVHCGIRTVEDLAMAGESELMQIGIGAISLRQKAQAWLESAKDRGVLVEEVSELRQKVADLTELVTKLVEANKAAKALAKAA